MFPRTLRMVLVGHLLSHLTLQPTNPIKRASCAETSLGFQYYSSTITTWGNLLLTLVRICLHSMRLRCRQACNNAHAKLMSRLKRHEAGNGALTPQTSLSPGTELIRSYQGQTYTVLVRGAGFEWNGSCYGSLSEIATLITGSRRSGPKFFGLKP